MAAVAQSTGRKLLKEVEEESGSLEDLLTSLRTTTTPNPTLTGLPSLDTHLTLSSSNPSPRLTLSGPHRTALLLSLLNHTLQSPNTVILLLDLSARFPLPFLRSLHPSQASRLYVHTAPASTPTTAIATLLATLQTALLEKAITTGNATRVLAYTVVFGAAQPPAAAAAAGAGAGEPRSQAGQIWVVARGGVHVEREFQTGGYGAGISVEEATRMRDDESRRVGAGGGGSGGGEGSWSGGGDGRGFVGVARGNWWRIEGV